MVDEKTTDYMRQVFRRWHELGLGPKKRFERMAELTAIIESVWVDVNELDSKSYEKMIKFKNHRHQQINEMLHALHEPPYDLPSDVSLIQTARILKTKFEELKKVKDERMNHLVSLREKRDEYCTRMGEEPLPLQLKTSIPAQTELVELQSYVSTLRGEMNHRKNRFTTTKEAIMQMVREMEYEPKTEFEKSVIVDAEDKFILSQGNLDKLIKFHKKLVKENEENKAKKIEMFKRLEYLWDKLDVPIEAREVIQKSYESNSIKTLESLKKDELDKYELIRQEKMAEFIEKLKPEVNAWWEKCYVSEMHKNTFLVKVATLEDESEEMLEAWEEELESWKKYFEERGHIFQSIETWSRDWEEFILIETAEKDPERYKSRRIPSTQLMKEQQRKKQLQSSIKKIETKLSELSDKFVSEGKPMMFHGVSLKEFILSKREEYEESKENEKEAKKVQKRNQLTADVLGFKQNQAQKGGGTFVPRKTPTKRPNVTSGQPSPASANKLRRLNGVPAASQQSRVTPMAARKLNLDTTGTLKKAGSKLPTPCTGTLTRVPSTMSINEDDFQAGLLTNVTKRKQDVNSTFVQSRR